MPLYTDDLRRILSSDRHTRKSFRGVYASDELPLHASSTSSLYVCNTDPSTESGEHWIAIYVDVKKRGEFFDSAGNLSPIDKPFQDFLERNVTT